MSISPARAAAFEVLLRVERDKSYAADLLHSARFASLSPSDHGLAMELVMGVLRWRSWIDDTLKEASSQKLERLDEEVVTALRMGIYQLSFLSRVPARAAIYESVELVKRARKSSAASFVNAVLRRVAGKSSQSGEERERDPLEEIEECSDPKALARSSAHPKWLVQRWVERFGLEIARRICEYDQTPPATSLRISSDSCLEELEREGVKLCSGVLLAGARTVLSGDVTRTSAFREGRVAIQDEGSQLVALLVGHGRRILDCCAAPGGKTALLARRNTDALIVACELHAHRARTLRERARLANVRVVVGDARQIPLRGGFDRILVDVPCSGTGTLARNPEIKWNLSSEDLLDLQARQVAILRSALSHLASGGRLVYSTCSMEREENEAVVETALDESSEFSLGDCRDEVEHLRETGEVLAEVGQKIFDGPYLRTIPGVHCCEGFFAAIIRKL
jgi:16S rRNA (cytosine967-C5)-methyltransferase